MNQAAATPAKLGTRLPRSLCMPKQYIPPHLSPSQEIAALCTVPLPFFK